MAKLAAINISESKGTRKKSVDVIDLDEQGLAGDAHRSTGHRMVSLLAAESIQKMKDMGLDVGSGDFAENLTTEGIDLLSLAIGERIRVGGLVVLEVTQHGKECHDRCAIYHQAGDCVMPREGIFARVIVGGKLAVGDDIERVEG